MVFFELNGALPSSVDKTAYTNKGNYLIRNLGTAFYREYLKRMVKKVHELLDYIIYSKEIPSDYYPDMTMISSEVILSIFQDYNYKIPSYIKKLNWRDDYSSDCNTVDVIQEIGGYYKNRKSNCKVTKDTFVITLGPDKISKRKTESWKNILPQELKCVLDNTGEHSRIIIDRKELEKMLGYKLSRFTMFDWS